MIRLENYSASLEQSAGAIMRPGTLHELARLVEDHEPTRDGQLTLRMGGHSFHNQALGHGVVVFLNRLRHQIRVVVKDAIRALDSGETVYWSTVETTGWTPWEAVSRATLGLDAPAAWLLSEPLDCWTVHRYAPEPRPEDTSTLRANQCRWQAGPGADPSVPLPTLIPYVLVSSGRITPGGSLSGDGTWRFSSVLGRESDSVVWLDLLRADGSIVRLYNSRWGLWDDRALHPGRQPARSRAENDAFFDAVIGGFGLLGVIVRVKYLLLELNEHLESDDFRLSQPAGHEQVRDRWRPGRKRATKQRRARARASRSGETARRRDPRWPDYPHASEHDLGQTGSSLTQRAITWMWPTDSADALFDTLARHRRDQELAGPDHGGIGLPVKVSERTVACFGMLFANSCKTMKGLIGNVAYGLPAPGAIGFKLWDRAYGWTNTARVMRWRLVPWLARIGEWFLYKTVFQHGMKNSPTANYIPEFAFFTEGHGIAMAEMSRKPQTVQQMWTIPFEFDDGDCHPGKELFNDFLQAVRDMSRQPRWWGNAVRIQICDIKCIPPARTLLSSSPGQNAMIVGVTVENVPAYRSWLGGWGSPQQAFARLTRQFAPRGVKVHLNKNLHMDEADLRRMYGSAFRDFLAIKRTLDPDDLWGSDFLDLMRGASS